MSDIIQLLPDAVANQIAAGEVVQRPSSAVKELLENALDAGADKITLVLKEAGKALIQVIDNGCGMSITDARMCLERHATSKIRKAADLFAIRTMGFRGEAMASIAAISQLELKTKRIEDELGTLINVEGSQVTKQESISTPTGTSVSVKNLFYNVPARRNFLKSNPVELKHVIDEFQRVAIANPTIEFIFQNEQQHIYQLHKSNLKQRIVNLFGKSYNERLVPVEEDTDLIRLRGFIGKTDFAKKTRGEQFLFVNNRFIRDAYLHHAIMSAYSELLPKDSYPLYVLFIDTDPAKIDINVHPTKTEIKFTDEKALYAIVRSTVRKSLGKYHVAPSLDFEQETGFSNLINQMKTSDTITQPTIHFNPDFNPFSQTQKAQPSNKSYSQQQVKQGIPTNWDSLYQITQAPQQTDFDFSTTTTTDAVTSQQPVDMVSSVIQNRQFFQLHGRYIISPIKSGLMMIDQHLAHERILYERYMQHLDNQLGSSQQCLFPNSISLQAADYMLLTEILPELKKIGFDIRILSNNAIVVDGVPANLSEVNEQELIENFLEAYKNNQSLSKVVVRENVARSLAKTSALKSGVILTHDLMNGLIDELFACVMPNISIDGKPIIATFTLDELANKFH